MAEYRRFIDSLCMTAGNGVLGTISAVSTTSNVDTYTLGTDGFGARLLRYGMTINVYSSDLSTNRTVGEVGYGSAPTKISYYDLVGKQISIPAVTGATAGDKIVAQGLSATPPVSILGVPYHDSNASTGSWMGFDRSVTPSIRATRVSGNNASLTLPL